MTDLRGDDLQTAAVERATEANGCGPIAVPAHFDNAPFKCSGIKCCFESCAAGTGMKDNCVVAWNAGGSGKAKPECLSNHGAA